MKSRRAAHARGAGGHGRRGCDRGGCRGRTRRRRRHGRRPDRLPGGAGPVDDRTWHVQGQDRRQRPQKIKYTETYGDLEGDVTQSHIHFETGERRAGHRSACARTSATGRPGRRRARRRGGTITGTLSRPTSSGRRAQGLAAGEFNELVRGDPRRRDVRERPHHRVARAARSARSSDTAGTGTATTTRPLRRNGIRGARAAGPLARAVSGSSRAGG